MSSYFWRTVFDAKSQRYTETAEPSLVFISHITLMLRQLKIIPRGDRIDITVKLRRFEIHPKPEEVKLREERHGRLREYDVAV